MIFGQVSLPCHFIKIYRFREMLIDKTLRQDYLSGKVFLAVQFSVKLLDAPVVVIHFSE